MKWVERLDRVPKPVVAAGTVVITLLITTFDYATKTEVSLAAFYLVPISLAALTLGFRFAVGISMLSIVVWWGSGKLSDDDDFKLGAFILYWNAGVQFAVDLLVIWALTSMRALQRNLEVRARERAAILVAEIAERERLQRELLEISEREQRRIGQDLHDGLCQHLAGTALAAQVLSEKLAARSAGEAGDAAGVVELVEQSIGLSRRIASGLHPVEMDPEGLMHALSQFAETASELYRVDCRFLSSGRVLVEDRRAAENLYRIVQEAVRNAVKHGGAKEIVIQLFSLRGRVALTIKDDGSGCNLRAAQNSGMGLRIMRHRARAIGSDFAIDAHETGGTVISVVPQSAKADELDERATA
ncbi:MAG TPA: ATP-binding protein [Rhizomicrobium sp.]|nr:ATP-binding protein [Rhizomicrobium sp.]